MINVSWYVGLILVVERTRGEERLRWEWKLMFKKIAPDLAKFVGLRIRNLLKTTLDSELGDWTRLGVLHTESVPQELWGGKLDYPKSISKVNFCFACQGIFEWKQQLFNFPLCTCCCLNILFWFQSVSCFMTELDFLLPFARAGTEGSILNCVRLAFVDAINLCLQNFHIHLTKVVCPICNIKRNYEIW